MLLAAGLKRRLFSQQNHSMFIGILCGLAAGALWGIVFVFPRLVDGYSATDLTAGRFLAYGLVAVIAMALRSRSKPLPTLAQATTAAWMSLLGFTGYYLVLVSNLVN